MGMDAPLNPPWVAWPPRSLAKAKTAQFYANPATPWYMCVCGEGVGGWLWGVASGFDSLLLNFEGPLIIDQTR